ncbi:MAG: cation:dicarboxylase symporter family transporter [Proteobacteria bacterium]|nr:cation:dicarboxylase symporter family transporter [Pseudomonadota bacterium]
MNSLVDKLKNTSLSFRIISGLILGIIVGLFVGERAAVLQIVADAWIRLMQMTVLPYVIFSLMAGLGGLGKQLARKLAVRGSLLMLLFWVIAFIVIAAFPQAFPELSSASFFSAHVDEAAIRFNPLDLYIPSNPFHSMANTIIPAVVLFSAALGIALIGIPEKNKLLDGFKVLIEALTRVTKFMVALTPIGVFAIVAVAAGTMTLAEIQKLEVYFVVYIVAALYLALWVMPVLISTLTPFRYRDVFRYSKDALITAFVTQNVFIILPLLIDTSRKLFRDYQLDSEDTKSLPEVIIPVTFNFPNAGKLLSLLFVPYAAWQSGTPMELLQYPSFLLTGLASYFAKAQVALPFLLDHQKLPQDLFQLYIPTGIINGKFDTMVSAMNLLAFSVIGTAALTGHLRFSLAKLIRLGGLSLLILFVTVLGTRIFLAYSVDTSYHKDKIILSMSLRQPVTELTVYRNRDEVDISQRRVVNDSRGMFEQISESGVLRVGYDPKRLPFTFFNNHDQLVGFDIELAGGLARELGARLELIPMSFETLATQLSSGEIDLVGTIPLSAEMLQKVDLSDFYLEGALSLVTADYRKQDFSSVANIKALGDLSIAYTGPIEYIKHSATRNYPNQNITWTAITDFRDFFEQEEGTYDALLVEVEIGTAWTLLYPSYTTVMPESATRKKMPLGFAVAKGQHDFAANLGRWLVAKHATGEIDQAYKYWILGEGAVPRGRRWSIMDDVLHWGENSD